MINKTIGILDFQTNNIASIFNSLNKIENVNVKIINQTSEFKDINHLIIPGVGSFGAGVGNLKKKNFLEEISFFSKDSDRFILGICLGAQILFERSEEDNKENYGSGIFKGTCKTLISNNKDIKIPHMGWNKVSIIKENKITKGVSNSFYAYFVHTYYLDPEIKTYILAETTHGINFSSIIGDENNFGIQFHPEKSGQAGFQILKNFTTL